MVTTFDSLRVYLQILLGQKQENNTYSTGFVLFCDTRVKFHSSFVLGILEKNAYRQIYTFIEQTAE